MTEKEIVLETIRALPDDCSLEEIAQRIEFMAAVQKGLDQLDRGEGIPHDEVKDSSPHGLQTNLVSRCTRRPSRYSSLHRTRQSQPCNVFRIRVDFETDRL